MMNSARRSITGALVLGALAMCAFGASGASAAGLTAVKVVKVPLTEETEVEGEAESTLMKSTIAGLKVTITCGVSHLLSGVVTNIEAEGEMKVHGTKNVLTYTECHASIDSTPTKTCRVQGTAPETPVGQLKTNLLTSTTGPEHIVTIKSEGATPITKFNILKHVAGEDECPFSSSVPVEVKGEVKGVANTETGWHLTLNPGNNGSGTKLNGATGTLETTLRTWMAGEKEITVGAETF